MAIMLACLALAAPTTPHGQGYSHGFEGDTMECQEAKGCSYCGTDLEKAMALTDGQSSGDEWVPMRARDAANGTTRVQKGLRNETAEPPAYSWWDDFRPAEAF